MIYPISFGQRYNVSAANNTPDAYRSFRCYCELRSHLAGKTIHSETKSSSGRNCLLDISDDRAEQVEDYCKINGINFEKVN